MNKKIKNISILTFFFLFSFSLIGKTFSNIYNHQKVHIKIPILSIKKTKKRNVQPILEGREYTVVENPVKNCSKVTLFFSFNCPYCFELYNSKLFNFIEKKLNLKIDKYNIILKNDEYNQAIAKFWAIARILNKEDIMEQFIFEAIDNSINDLEILKVAFLQNSHISKEVFDKMWNSKVTSFEVNKQEYFSNQMGIENVPSILVCGKYLINPDCIKSSNKQEVLKRYSEIIEFLLKKENIY